MDEYIGRGSIYKTLSMEKPFGWNNDDLAKLFREAKPADVAPVRHGQWLNFYGDFSTAKCSLCAELYEVSTDEPPRKEFFDAFKEFYNFCPNCGAKMDGGKDGV